MNALGALRDWPVSEQVALLFVGLFGTLLLLTLVGAAIDLRDARGPIERPAESEERRAAFRRELRAAWVGAVVFWLAWISGAPGATLLFGVLSFLALREFVTLIRTRRGDHRALLLAFFVALPAQYALVGTRHFDLFTVFIPVYVFLALPVASALAGDPEHFLERNAKIQWGMLVCVYGLSHAPALLLLEFSRHEARGAFLLFFLVVTAAAAQLAEDAAERSLRRRPVARQISRSFSLSIFAIGVAVGGAAGAALFWITPFGAPRAFAIAALAAAAGSCGDFVMQALKRDAGVQVWGNRASVTGAVGLLDRVAPLCFAAPIFFHSVRWYFERSG